MGTWGLFALVVSWMPTILMEGGWSETMAGLFSSLSSLFGVITSVISGVMADRFADRRRILIPLAGGVVTVFVGVLSASIASGSHTLAVAVLPLIGLAAYAGAPLSLAVASESVDSEHVAAVNGLVLNRASLGYSARRHPCRGDRRGRVRARAGRGPGEGHGPLPGDRNHRLRWRMSFYSQFAAEY